MGLELSREKRFYLPLESLFADGHFMRLNWVLGRKFAVHRPDKIQIL